jgi:uncharacterized protein with PIN domain
VAATAIDTNALIALLYDDEPYAAASEDAIRAAYRDGRLVVSPVVYAELAADGEFGSAGCVDEFLSDFSIDVARPSRDALYRAGEAFDEYTANRPDGLKCPDCGAEREVAYATCGRSLAPRQHVAADFLVGGHAVEDGDALVTFDGNFYETYFPSLPVRPDR